MADAPHSTKARPRSAIRAKVDGNRLELIEGGAERLDLLLELIAGATASVKLLFYMFDPDPVGTRVRDALVEASRRGIEVKLLIDGFGSAAPVNFFADLEEGGGETRVFNSTYGRSYL